MQQESTDWADWNGFDSVGMGLITKAITGLWILIGLILTASLFQLLRVLSSYMNGKRQFDFNVKGYSVSQYLQNALFVILLSALIWSFTRDYLMITSVFPGVSSWFLATVVISALLLLISVLVPVAEHTPKMNS